MTGCAGRKVCSVVTPPVVLQREGRVVFHVVHGPTGDVFRCAMVDFGVVTIEPLLRDSTTGSSGAVRGVVVETALHHAASNLDQFTQLFALVAKPRADKDGKSLAG